jgi:DNA-binding NtrC family response regulator
LQERVVVPVGGVEGTPVDIRLVCATNRDLQAEVAQGTFRQDLYYRLNVVQLRTIALKERTADIAVLAEHFLVAMARETGMPRKTVSLPAQVLLAAYPWPGNVRQLRNILERAVVFSDGDEMKASLLARLLSEEQSCEASGFQAKLSSEEDDSALGRSIRFDSPSESRSQVGDARREVLECGQSPTAALSESWVSLAAHERAHVLRTLEYTGFNQTEAARLLQTTSRILAGKIKRYGIDVTQSRRGRPAKAAPRPPR